MRAEEARAITDTANKRLFENSSYGKYILARVRKAAERGEHSLTAYDLGYSGAFDTADKMMALGYNCEVKEEYIGWGKTSFNLLIKW